ncbi:DUF3099 domain-containing protein [Nocardioides sp. W7]|uniref:DUF3099 domain-containing protein n=1 Tax=Nocardioides sp. W7 TaxID=2931390 RepID=UPI001FD5A7EA|nr:DUF3099 domain-containing protein [Nocardioides sp. W7]
MPRDRHRSPDAVRITTAPSDRNADIAARQRRYLLSMSLRSLCFVGAIVAALAGVDWLWPILIAGALVLPYVAVVMANAVTTRSDAFDLADTAYRPELGSTSTKPLDEGGTRL